MMTIDDAREFAFTPHTRQEWVLAIASGDDLTRTYLIDHNPYKSHFVVKSASAAMPNSCWGVYARVAVLEIETTRLDVSMISERARGVIEVVATWEKLNVGTTERCAYQRALKEAEALAAELNGCETSIS